MWLSTRATLKVRAYTLAELDALAAELEPRYVPLVSFAAATGLRPAEWAALERRDIDRDRRLVHVRGTEVDAAAAKLDEEQDVVAAERDRLDGEEVTGERARRLLAEEVAPARTARRGAGLSPAARSCRRTVLGEMRTPSFSSSPATRG
jgi:integrase